MPIEKCEKTRHNLQYRAPPNQMGAKHCLHHDAQHVMALCSFVQVMWMLLNSYNAGTSPSRVNYYVVSMSCLLCSITAILRHKADAAFLVYFCVLAVSGGNAITSDNVIFGELLIYQRQNPVTCTLRLSFLRQDSRWSWSSQLPPCSS